VKPDGWRSKLINKKSLVRNYFRSSEDDDDDDDDNDGEEIKTNLEKHKRYDGKNDDL
jgi:hypothetical protein